MTRQETMVAGLIRPNKVTDTRILKAFCSVDREMFLSPALRHLAYTEDTLQLHGRFLLSPLCLARLFQLAKITEEERILVIAPASGYSLALLAKLACQVVGVEDNQALLSLAKGALQKTGDKNITLMEGDPSKGAWDGKAFDVIFIEGGVDCVPSHLFKQLISPTGRLMTILNKHPSKALTGGAKGTVGQVITLRQEGGSTSIHSHFEMSIPTLPGFVKKESFNF